MKAVFEDIKLQTKKFMWNVDKGSLEKGQSYIIDQYWQRLQQKDNWFIVNPALIIQRPSTSSISNTFVDYRQNFNL